MRNSWENHAASVGCVAEEGYPGGTRDLSLDVTAGLNGAARMVGTGREERVRAKEPAGGAGKNAGRCYRGFLKVTSQGWRVKARTDDLEDIRTKSRKVLFVMPRSVALNVKERGGQRGQSVSH